MQQSQVIVRVMFQVFAHHFPQGHCFLWYRFPYKSLLHEIYLVSRWTKWWEDDGVIMERIVEIFLCSLRRNRRPEVFCKNAVYENSQENTSAWSLFLIKLQNYCNFVKWRLRNRYSLVIFAKFFRAGFLKSSCERLILTA